MHVYTQTAYLSTLKAFSRVDSYNKKTARRAVALSFLYPDPGGLALPAEFTGGDTCCLAEYPQEIGVITETAAGRDFLQRHIRLHHLPRQLNAAGQNVIVNASSRNPGKFMAQVADADAEALCQVISPNRLGIIGIDIC